MTLDERPTLLAIQHVPWEGPHRILDACGDLPDGAELEATLIERTAPGFEAFAEIVAAG